MLTGLLPHAGELGRAAALAAVRGEELGRPETVEAMAGFLFVVLVVGAASLGTGAFMWGRAVDRAMADWAARDRPEGLVNVALPGPGDPPGGLLPPPERGPWAGPGT